MAVISEVKCGRCDRRYSGFRSRCPYCGARRNRRGKRADETDNAKAKLVIGISLLVLLIAATMILIITSQPDNSQISNPTDSSNPTDLIPSGPDDADSSAVVDTSEPGVTESPSPSQDIIIEVAEVIITAYGGPIKDNDFTLGKITESIQLDFKTIPETTDKKATWASSDEDVFMVTSDGKVTATGRGSATLTCTVDGAVGKCTVRVKGA